MQQEAKSSSHQRFLLDCLVTESEFAIAPRRERLVVAGTRKALPCMGVLSAWCELVL